MGPITFMTLPRFFTRPFLRAIAGGICTTLTVPPFSIWPLAFVGIALLFHALGDTHRARNRFAVGWLWAAGLYIPSLWWMTAFSVPGGIFVALLESTITALCIMILVPRNQPNPDTMKKQGPLPRAFGLISALMIADSLRSLWPFGGLPLSGIDLGQANGPLLPIVSIFGRLGLIGTVAGIGVALAALVQRRGRTKPQVTAGIGIVLLIPVALGLTVGRSATASSDNTMLIRAIQGGGPRGLLASAENATRTYNAHLAATTKALTRSDKPGLWLWPENTIDADNFATSPAFTELRRITGSYLSVGITEDGGPKEFLNAQVLINPDGELVGRYDKVRRVPYGEYFPFRTQIESWGLADLPARDARPGTKQGTLQVGDTTLGVLISYEGFFDDRSRGAVRSGAQAILIPTNASSYKTTQLPSQQVAAAQLRAVETGRVVIQVGPTGYSAAVDHRGRVITQTGLGSQEVFDTNVALRTGQTPYVRWNDLPALLIAAALGIVAQLHRFLRRRT
jgi:apolipoprotein N-acyltransferase